MNFSIAFPIDYGNEDESTLVVVKLERADFHFVKNGKQGYLRPKSGAKFVFTRLKPEIREFYHFEFSFIERKNVVVPNQIADRGDSDACACALASAQFVTSTDKNPIVSISCAFNREHKKELGLHDLVIEKVTDSSDLIASQQSLKNKWNAACRIKALALVLHESDASLLHEVCPTIEKIPLGKNIFEKRLRQEKLDTCLVSCKSENLPLLAESLGIDSTSFCSIEEQREKEQIQEILKIPLSGSQEKKLAEECVQSNISIDTAKTTLKGILGKNINSVGISKKKKDKENYKNIIAYLSQQGKLKPWLAVLGKDGVPFAKKWLYKLRLVPEYHGNKKRKPVYSSFTSEIYQRIRILLKKIFLKEDMIAGFWLRFLTIFIDILVLWAFGTIISLILWVCGGNGKFLWIGFLFSFIYFAVLDSWVCKGQTIGKKICGIHVIRKNGLFLTLKQSSARNIILLLAIYSNCILDIFSFLQYLGYDIVYLAVSFIVLGESLLVFFEALKRGVGDLLAGSLLVSRRLPYYEKEKVEAVNQARQLRKGFIFCGVWALLCLMGRNCLLEHKFVRLSREVQLTIQRELKQNNKFRNIKVEVYNDRTNICIDTSFSDIRNAKKLSSSKQELGKIAADLFVDKSFLQHAMSIAKMVDEKHSDNSDASLFFLKQYQINVAIRSGVNIGIGGLYYQESYKDPHRLDFIFLNNITVDLLSPIVLLVYKYVDIKDSFPLNSEEMDRVLLYFENASQKEKVYALKVLYSYIYSNQLGASKQLARFRFNMVFTKK